MCYSVEWIRTPALKGQALETRALISLFMRRSAMRTHLGNIGSMITAATGLPHSYTSVPSPSHRM